MFEKLFNVLDKFSGLSSYIQGVLLLVSHIFVAIIFFILGLTLARPVINVHTKDGKQQISYDNGSAVLRSEDFGASSPLPSDSSNSSSEQDPGEGL